MDVLKKMIVEKGIVKGKDVLKVDSFLNHQLDVDLLDKIGEEFYRRFKEDGITKILTIEASGIAIAVMTARYFKVPVVFAKKSRSKNVDASAYTAKVISFTRGTEVDIIVSDKYLSKDDTVLILDDFLAKGNALDGLMEIVEKSGAKIAGAGIAIEKGFDEGGKRIRQKGVKVESLAIVKSMDENGIVFAE